MGGFAVKNGVPATVSAFDVRLRSQTSTLATTGSKIEGLQMLVDCLKLMESKRSGWSNRRLQLR